ncbi:MAG: WbqC family protein [Lachnospiraceae bacterium]|nr:WbqC family protein [Lachnospiraceae bacterium]
MKIGIMQPYFWPYLGYFQLLYAVDQYVIYDNIKYTKKGWINRNRYLWEGQAKYFTIPIAKGSDELDICERKVAGAFDRRKLKAQIRAAYSKAPYFEQIFPLFCECIDCMEENLFCYLYCSVRRIADYLEIPTKIIVSSDLQIGHEARGKDKVLAICRKLQADTYINPIGGKALYQKQEFEQQGIQLHFLEMEEIPYPQFGQPFVGSLSILDVLMFQSREQVMRMLERYRLD